MNSDFLFVRSLSLINLIIHSFSVRHNRQISELEFPRTFDAIEYLTEKIDVTTCQLLDIFSPFDDILILFMFKVPSMVYVPFFKRCVYQTEVKCFVVI